MKMSSLPRKDILKNKKITESTVQIQNVANPFVKQTKKIPDKLTHLKFIDHISPVYQERVLHFGKSKVTPKI